MKRNDIGGVLIIFMVILPGFSAFSQPAQANTVLKAADYPFIAEWVKAGVEGGVPDTRRMKVIATVKPGDDLEQAIDRAAKKGRGIVLLATGEHILRKTVRIPGGMVLRGADRQKVLLSVKIHGYHFKTGKPRMTALLVRNARGTGIENLTIKYTDASFEPLDKDSMNTAWDKRVFHEKELRDTTLFVEHIWIDSSTNCWVRNCDLLWAGSDPLRITNSSHVSCSGNFIDRSYNKNDGGMGYYNIIHSHHVLVYNERIRRIRHFAIQNNSKYNVVIKNYLEVDINFHNDDDGYNLIESNTIRIPNWHSWHCFMRGAPNQHKVPGKMNILFNNDAIDKSGIKEAPEPGKVYVINPVWEGGRILTTDLPSPAGNTFYPVKIR
ncbi:MAG: right-handed parallel beta-helix repeat-containing protein [Chitinophagaceae bacterium]|nr:right-handed parallel beta-helix repeat-containing protein [Chitinophagaceae bacterium]